MEKENIIDKLMLMSREQIISYLVEHLNTYQNRIDQLELEKEIWKNNLNICTRERFQLNEDNKKIKKERDQLLKEKNCAFSKKQLGEDDE